MVNVREYKISGIFQENSTCKTIRVEPCEGKRFDFKPGQFLMLYLLDAAGNPTDLKRPYSISSSPTENNYLEVTFKIQGVFTNELSKKKENDLLGVDGPYGSFVFDESIKDDLVFIAGGVGITPFKSMLRYITSKNLSNSVKLFYSSRYCENFLCRSEFEEFKERKSNLDCILSITGNVIPENWKGEEGRVDEKMLKSKIGSFNGKLFYICGPPPMVNEMVEILSRNGVKNNRIKREGWG